MSNPKKASEWPWIVLGTGLAHIALWRGGGAPLLYVFANIVILALLLSTIAALQAQERGDQ